MRRSIKTAMDEGLFHALLNRTHVSTPGDSTHLPSWPSGSRGPTIEAAVIHHHRFAFYYWLKWTTNRWTRFLPEDNTAPHLLTIDWHDDVGVKDDRIFDEAALLVDRFNRDDTLESNERLRTIENDVAAYSFLGLPASNDGHIYPAQHINAIGDVFVLYKQGGRQTHQLIDRFGNQHLVEYFDAPDQLADQLRMLGANRSMYIDLDTDYFFDNGEGYGAEVMVDESEIRELLDTADGLMSHVMPNAKGLTFALEPTYCGGLDGCFRAMSIITDSLFRGSLLGRQITWK